MWNLFAAGKALVVAILALGMMAVPFSVSLAQEPGPIKAFNVDAKKAELGKRLFFDERLSGNATISCATCHIPEKAFADGLALSKAYPGLDGFRNTPTLINTALKAAWFHDGRLGTNLNDVTREVITEAYIMNMDMRLMQERLKQDPIYVKMFKEAGYGEPDNSAVRKAIPEYLKSLTSRGAPFDKGSMSNAAKKGFELFKGKAGCIACHSGSRFSDDKPHNLGVPDNPDIWSNPQRHLTFVAYAMSMGIENHMNIRHDPGAHLRAHKADGTDVGKFMTPTLRELKYTAPYMHNGMLKTLKDVVAFYDKGGGEGANKDSLLKPLALSAQEQSDLVAFLNALSGDLLTGAKYVWEDKIDTDYSAIPNFRKTPN